MSHKKAKREQPKPRRASFRQFKRWRILLVASIFCLLLAGALMARRRSQPTAFPPPGMTLLPQAASSATPNPFAPKRAAREYVYRAGRLQAIEESLPPKGGVAFDFTGNGSGDAVIWRPSEGNWYVLDLATNLNSLQQLGSPNEIMVPGDYDGDSRADIAVWRPNTGVCGSNNCGWRVKQSSDGVAAYHADWGQSGDVPVPADYDGDGKTDMAVWRPGNGNWHIINSSGGASVIGWGNSTDQPAPADYDGDGRADLAVFRPGEGVWHIRQSAGGTLAQGWGASGDWLAPADYDGDGKADLTVWRPSEGNWYIRQSSNGQTRLVNWGALNDVPVPADYDGDGRVDIAVWRPTEGSWYVRKSSDGATLARNWGQLGDQPVPAAYVRRPT